jgi:glucose 1-dehydrogenase
MALNGSRALVTGGSNGIGAAVVETLQARGVAVGVLDLEPAPGTPEAWRSCDIAEEDQVVSGIAEISQALGGLDLAVLNAGVGGYSPLLSMTSQEWDRVMAVNLRGTFLCLREVAKVMTAARRGSIVVTSSISGSSVERGMGHYNVSKGGVDQLVRVAARELGPAGVRVNAVAPGATQTPLFAPTQDLPGYWEQVSTRTPLGGIGTARAVAEAAVALLDLEWVTGQILAADGGVSLFSAIDPTESMERP